MPSKKNKRKRPERPTIHPKNKYSDNPPDFSLLASLYPSLKPFVLYSRDGRPRIDWTDFNSTRELTRVLLLHDHGLNWWIPDGQLCPTVPNRLNYIHWALELTAFTLYLVPLFLDGHFVGSDVTDVALEWAEKNVKGNQHISELIEIRKVTDCQDAISIEDSNCGESVNCENKMDGNVTVVEEAELLPSSFDPPLDMNKKYSGPPLLLGVVRDGEKFDFCMCNPPFFETMEEAGLNPKTSCGGTPEEMVCPGGEKAFITRIIEDSVVLKESFRWFTSMVGRKVNLKFLTSKLREVGVTIVKTTEFVQGQTSYLSLLRVFNGNSVPSMYYSQLSPFFCTGGASCKLNASSFVVDITASNDQCKAILGDEAKPPNGAATCNTLEASQSSSYLHPPSNNLSFRVSVFQQIPGTLLVKASLQHRDGPVPGVFSLIIQQLEKILRCKFCREKTTRN
ncbi:hypothetical protein OIU84_014956 [Salix udensis]|uniref:U6 small nuclear RNA (adenine-(43)-N(6))-methyltransferase n=1 Tax=Salix udensis TaxID=889485 RepID=A0AAD6JEY9_9ROSI|nr:hypothetical protein OIU84_014956 [Salix udensis]